MHVLIKFGDLGTYIVDFDAEVNYNDRFILANKKTKHLMLDVSPYPSEKDLYKRVKVIWYYEKPGTDNTCVYRDPEAELTHLLAQELGREIDRQILNNLVEQTPWVIEKNFVDKK